VDWMEAILSVLVGSQDTDDGELITDRSVNDVNQRGLAIEYLEQVVRGLGYEDVERQTFTKTKKPPKQLHKIKGKDEREVQYNNLIVTLHSDTGNSDDVIVVGAHYDVQNSYSSCWRGKDKEYVCTAGADDNGSGVVAALAILRRLKNDNVSLPVTLQVVFFDGEEPGWLCGFAVGSGEYYKSLESKTVKFALILDMVGAKPSEHLYAHMANVDDADSFFDYGEVWEVFKKLEEEKGIKMLSCTDTESVLENCVQLSDSYWFASFNIPTILLCHCCLSTIPPHYHTNDDDLSVIHWPSFVDAVDVAYALLAKSFALYVA